MHLVCAIRHSCRACNHQNVWTHFIVLVKNNITATHDKTHSPWKQLCEPNILQLEISIKIKTFCKWPISEPYKSNQSAAKLWILNSDTLRARLGREGDLGSRNVWVAVQILNWTSGIRIQVAPYPKRTTGRALVLYYDKFKQPIWTKG